MSESSNADFQRTEFVFYTESVGHVHGLMFKWVVCLEEVLSPLCRRRDMQGGDTRITLAMDCTRDKGSRRGSLFLHPSTVVLIFSMKDKLGGERQHPNKVLRVVHYRMFGNYERRTCF